MVPISSFLLAKKKTPFLPVRYLHVVLTKTWNIFYWYWIVGWL